MYFEYEFKSILHTTYKVIFQTFSSTLFFFIKEMNISIKKILFPFFSIQWVVIYNKEEIIIGTIVRNT